MPRDLTIAAKNATKADNVVEVFLVRLDFGSGVNYLTTADRSVVYGGNTYLALGKLGRISNFSENGQLDPEKLELEISGVDTANIYIALAENYQGRAADIYSAYFDTSTFVLIADPILVFKGSMDNMEIALGKTASIRVNVVSILDNWRKAKVRRYNNDDQQGRYLGDKGLVYVEQIAQGKKLEAIL